jgi:hypothetical protein
MPPSVLNDDDLRRWVEVEGKTQTEIAALVGVTQSTVSKRCAAIGLKSSSNRGRPRNISENNSNPEPPTNPAFFEWVGEQIDAALDAGRITPRSAPAWRARLEADPGPTAKTIRSLAAIESVALANREHVEAAR